MQICYFSLLLDVSHVPVELKHKTLVCEDPEVKELTALVPQGIGGVCNWESHRSVTLVVFPGRIKGFVGNVWRPCLGTWSAFVGRKMFCSVIVTSHNR